MLAKISIPRVYWGVVYILISGAAVVAVAGAILTLILGQSFFGESPFRIAALIGFPVSMFGGFLLIGGVIFFPHSVRKSKKKNQQKE